MFFNDFIGEMMILNLIESIGEVCEEYEFGNIVFFAYFLINSRYLMFLLIAGIGK